MTAILDGQVSIFDLLDAGRPLAKPKHPHMAPTPSFPIYCVMCGAEQKHYFDYSVNHTPMGWAAGQRMCTAMNLTRNHVSYAVNQIVKSLSGEMPDQCCWDNRGLHGKAVRKPTVMQLADHLRWQIDRTRQAWGNRAALFDAWIVATLIDYGVFRYSLDPEEYPEEFESET